MLKLLASLTRRATAEREAAALQKATDLEMAANALAHHCGDLHDALNDLVCASYRPVNPEARNDALRAAQAVLDQAKSWGTR